MNAKLSMVGGPASGQTIQIPRGKLLIGRAEDCDVRPESEFVSGYHCVLLLDDYTLRIRDLGSKNGTIVNGRRIGTGVTILLHDDMVSIGEMNMLVDLTESTATALEGTGLFEGETLEAEISKIVPPRPAPPASAPASGDVIAPTSDETASRT
ncbi:MAG TPA: FHA domain-containing protein [Planctomycetaceae bacterium]|jgi:predicted component of type VI protein secretion system|nr:FHA domain-containing protein [Planctomycetaceae bacterium]